jgi:tRNA U54 and U55 pseudouridine synthase Pus10
MTKEQIRERSIEAQFARFAKLMGCKSYKFTSPGRRGVPDRLVALPGGRAFFIEFKQPGKKLSALQNLEHLELQGLGFPVYVCDRPGQAEAILEMILEGKTPNEFCPPPVPGQRNRKSM